MSFSDKPRRPRAPREPGEPREPRPPRKARARISLKMQAIGFLSRREHSRQELRAKLLDSLRKRAREEAALAAATEKATRDLAEALHDQPSNGIDDAFTPPVPEPETFTVTTRGARRGAPAHETPAPRARARHARPDADVQADAAARANDGSNDGITTRVGATRGTTLDRPGLDTLTLATGAPLPAALRASLAASASGAASTPASAPARAATASTAPSEHRLPAIEVFGELIDIDVGDPLLEPAADRPCAPLDATDLELADPEAAVDELLDWLVANKYLSETRFVESRVNARSRKQGALLIKLELSRHGLTLEPEQAATLRETEFARAQALWQRKFGEVAPDARLRARQARFLAARGFAADVVRRVVGGLDED